ncbi:hypothetical protein [Agrococcus jenensis]|uniref:Uncharacterized protein n=1 Tax=Agrococcus jenensis TaxID=46353 RepID=A0A3N2ATI5_9MICO|nr:hypothetical protein [Agrococcus jenensis]ROR66228.1 hypothetical protein EDD26_1609 [Agrococcus jenensis]
MALLITVLRIVTFFAWVTTAIALLQTLKGAPWSAAVLWGGLSLVLALACAAARHADAVAEQRAVQHAIERAAGRDAVPADPGGSALFVAGWICGVVGVGVAIAGVPLTSSGTWWVLLVGCGLMALAIPVFEWESRRWAAHVLPWYEADVLANGGPKPTSELRLALWNAAHASAQPGTTPHEQQENVVEAYRSLVGAWSGTSPRPVADGRAV